MAFPLRPALWLATHVHLHDDQCTCINSGRLQGDIRLTKLAALRGAKKKKKNKMLGCHTHDEAHARAVQSRKDLEVLYHYMGE